MSQSVDGENCLIRATNLPYSWGRRRTYGHSSASYSTASHALHSVIRVTNKMFPRLLFYVRPSMLVRQVWSIALAVFVRVCLSDKVQNFKKNYW